MAPTTQTSNIPEPLAPTTKTPNVPAKAPVPTTQASNILTGTPDPVPQPSSVSAVSTTQVSTVPAVAPVPTTQPSNIPAVPATQTPKFSAVPASQAPSVPIEPPAPTTQPSNTPALPVPKTQPSNVPPLQEEDMSGAAGMMEDESVAFTIAPTSPSFTFTTPATSKRPEAPTPSGSGILGGGGGFFSGLGGQPSAESAKKNVFAMPSSFSFGSPSAGKEQAKSLFGNSPASGAASPSTFGFGGASGGSPNVGNQGFGSFGAPQGKECGIVVSA